MNSFAVSKHRSVTDIVPTLDSLRLRTHSAVESTTITAEYDAEIARDDGEGLYSLPCVPVALFF